MKSKLVALIKTNTQNTQRRKHTQHNPTFTQWTHAHKGESTGQRGGMKSWKRKRRRKRRNGFAQQQRHGSFKVRRSFSHWIQQRGPKSSHLTNATFAETARDCVHWRLLMMRRNCWQRQGSVSGSNVSSLLCLNGLCFSAKSNTMFPLHKSWWEPITCWLGEKKVTRGWLTSKTERLLAWSDNWMKRTRHSMSVKNENPENPENPKNEKNLKTQKMKKTWKPKKWKNLKTQKIQKAQLYIKSFFNFYLWSLIQTDINWFKISITNEKKNNTTNNGRSHRTPFKERETKRAER